MRIQLWSYNYDLEPQGFAPLSRMLALELSSPGHEAGFTYAKKNFRPHAVAAKLESVLTDVIATSSGSRPRRH